MSSRLYNHRLPYDQLHNHCSPMITPLYAALLAVLFIVLSVRTIRVRRTLKIAVGSGNNQRMMRAMRVQANFIEYTPLALLLFFMLEIAGGMDWLTHSLCICLLVGRISHAYGMSSESENFTYRVSGMACTFTSIGSAALLLLIQGILPFPWHIAFP